MSKHHLVDSKRARRRKLLCFAVGLAVFVLGLASFATALADTLAASDATPPHPHRVQQDAPAGEESPQEPANGEAGQLAATSQEDDTDADMLADEGSGLVTSASGRAEGASAGEVLQPEEAVEQQSVVDDNEKAKSSEEKAKPKKGIRVAKPKKAKKAKKKEKPSAGNETVALPEASAASSAQTTRVIHHTKSKRTPVYRTVHHEASSHERSDDDGTTITWSPCPACGKTHEKAYDEEVVDHYETTTCAACGKVHGHAFDETVSG